LERITFDPEFAGFEVGAQALKVASGNIREVTSTLKMKGRQLKIN
jgi:hypothetical protein